VWLIHWPSPKFYLTAFPEYSNYDKVSPKVIIIIIIIVITEDSRETAFLFQRLSMALQRGNAVSYQNTMTTE